VLRAGRWNHRDTKAQRNTEMIFPTKEKENIEQKMRNKEGNAA
jgi:hypothetical protein